jgi:hypothetical protein
MDSNTHQQQNQSNSSGLLRFRSAPSSLFQNITPSFPSSGDSNKVTKHFWDGSESERFVSNDNNNISGSSCSKEMNSGYGAGLPPHYPRHGSASSSAMDGSFGLVGSLGMDQETSHDKNFGSNLLRQGSSPAGLFSNISFQNGNMFYVVILVWLFILLYFWLSHWFPTHQW